MLGLRMSEILRLYCSIVILTTSSTSNFFHERLEDSERGPIHLSSTEEACKQVNAPNGHRQHKPWSNKQVFCFGPLLYTCGFLKSSILIGLSMINQPVSGSPVYGNPHVWMFLKWCVCAGSELQPNCQLLRDGRSLHSNNSQGRKTAAMFMHQESNILGIAQCMYIYIYVCVCAYTSIIMYIYIQYMRIYLVVFTHRYSARPWNPETLNRLHSRPALQQSWHKF